MFERNKVDNAVNDTKNGVPAEIHLYEKGGHGFGMNNKTSSDKWMDWLKTWMQKNGWVK